MSQFFTAVVKVLEWGAIAFSLTVARHIIFHAKMGTIKDRNYMDLTEVEDIKKRWHHQLSGHEFV